VIRTKLERNIEPPTWFFERPDLLPGQNFYLEAFDQLTTCRFVGGGSIGRIPWTALWKYSEAHGMSEEEFKLFQHVINCMDTFYVQWVIENSKGAGDNG